MAAASQKKKITAAVHTTTKAQNVRHYTEYVATLFHSSFGEVEILIYMKYITFAFPNAVPNCVLTKELLTDGLKVLISKEDELLYAARVHTLELPDM